jgi:DNA (cytosine-5)-methyltransferase 1
LKNPDKNNNKSILLDIKEEQLSLIRNTLLDKIKEELNKEFTKNNWDPKQLNYIEKKYNSISLFCGAGGLDLGMELAGLDVIYGKELVDIAFKNKNSFDELRGNGIFHQLYSNDFFKEALQTYRQNFNSDTFVDLEDIRKIKSFPKGDIVLGGFPCPGFSEAGPRLIDDPRNFLYIHYIRCLIESKPKFFIAENVKGMLTLGKGEVFKQIVQDFTAAGYRVHHKLVNARDYGVPQLRERVFLIGVRNDIDFEYVFPIPTHGEGLKPYVTLEDSIKDLLKEPGEYFKGGYSSIFKSRNRKKLWTQQSFTIQASGRQAPIHPNGDPMIKLGKDQWEFSGVEEDNRRLSVKEIARIQTFPDWFQFHQGEVENISDNGRLNKIYKQIGNAVPIELARAIVSPIAKWIVENEGKRT